MPAPKRTTPQGPAEPPAGAREAFRETFAALFPYTSLPHSLGRLLASLAEFAESLPASATAGEATQMETALRAAAADLRCRQASDRKLIQSDRQLARGAGRHVVRVGAIAQAIEETVDAAQAARRATD